QLSCLRNGFGSHARSSAHGSVYMSDASRDHPGRTGCVSHLWNGPCSARTRQGGRQCNLQGAATQITCCSHIYASDISYRHVGNVTQQSVAAHHAMEILELGAIRTFPSRGVLFDVDVL